MLHSRVALLSIRYTVTVRQRKGGGERRQKGNPISRLFLLTPRRGEAGKCCDGKILGRKLRKILYQNVSLTIFSLNNFKFGVYGAFATTLPNQCRH